MIPKVIHYVWLSGDRKSTHIQKCMETWTKRLPDYEIRCWTLNDTDALNCDYVQEAVTARKWAFASDYIRMYALNTCGGFYFDSDVVVKKPFDDFRKYGFVTGIEYHKEEFERNADGLLDAGGCSVTPGTSIPGIGIQAAVMGAEAGHPFTKSCLEWYGRHHFSDPDGSLHTDLISPSIYAMCAEQYGFVYRNVQQQLDPDMMIFDSSVFAGGFGERTPESFAVHFAEGTWRNKTWTERMRQNLMNNSFVRSIFRKEPLY